MKTNKKMKGFKMGTTLKLQTGAFFNLNIFDKENDCAFAKKKKNTRIPSELFI